MEAEVIEQAPEQEYIEDVGVIQDQSEDLEQSDEEPEQAEDSEEIELDGQKYVIPKALKPAFMMHSDYTKKTQEVAEQRKAIEAQQTQIAQKAQEQEIYLQESAQKIAIDAQLSQFQQVDWYRLAEEDPVKWQQLFSQRKQLEDSSNYLNQQIEQKKQQFAVEQQQSMAKLIEQSNAVLARDIPGYTPELEQNIKQFAIKEFGFDSTDVEQSKADPRIYKLLHKAYLGDQILKKQGLTKPTQQQIKPATVISSKKSASPLAYSPNMTDAQYAAWRKKQSQK